MGTYMTDDDEVNLLAGLDLDADDNYWGTAHQCDYPGPVSFTLTLPDPAAADDATIEVQIIGCETADFSTAPVIPIASFGLLGEAAHNVAVTAGQASYVLRTFVDHKYVAARAVVIDGTNGDWNVGDAATLYMRPFVYHQSAGSQATADTDTWLDAAGPFNPAA